MYILESVLIDVMCVIELSVKKVNLNYINMYILESIHISVVSVIKLVLARVPIVMALLTLIL